MFVSQPNVEDVSDCPDKRPSIEKRALTIEKPKPSEPVETRRRGARREHSGGYRWKLELEGPSKRHCKPGSMPPSPHTGKLNLAKMGRSQFFCSCINPMVEGLRQSKRLRGVYHIDWKIERVVKHA